MMQDTEDPSQLTFLWEMYRNPKRYDGTYENVLLNHLQNNNCLVSKKGLYFCMKNYCQEKNIDLLQVIPRTFFISVGSNANEQTEFMEYNDRCKRAFSASKKTKAPPSTAAVVTGVPEVTPEGDATVAASVAVVPPEEDKSPSKFFSLFLSAMDIVILLYCRSIGRSHLDYETRE
jgi:hypothetical protein